MRMWVWRGGDLGGSGHEGGTGQSVPEAPLAPAKQNLSEEGKAGETCRETSRGVGDMVTAERGSKRGDR